MCLDKIITHRVKSTGFGYKVFSVNNRVIRSRDINNLSSLPIGKWINEKDYRPLGSLQFKHLATHTYKEFLFWSYKQKYKCGFHILMRRVDAVIWSGNKEESIYEVEYRKAHTLGIQDDYHIIVASEIRILPKQINRKIYIEMDVIK